MNLTEREWSKTERGQFTFYASFAVALKRLRDPAERCAAYDAIIDYALRGAAPDLDALPDWDGESEDWQEENGVRYCFCTYKKR